MQTTIDRESQIKKILNLLKTKKTVSNYELNHIAFRYAARIAELRADGYRIVSVHVGGSLWNFVFKGHEDDDDKVYDCD